MDNQLVRIYRDIEHWDALTKDAEQDVRRIMRNIMALDEQIAIANGYPDQELLQSYEFAVQMANLGLEREALYNEWVATNGRLKELRSIPRQRLELQEYLEACHSIDLAMPARDILPSRFEVITDEAEIESTIYPQHIVPATDFAAKQMDIWSRLSQGPEICDGAWYTGYLELEWIRAKVDANIVGCPHSLFTFMGDTVDEAVTDILGRIVKDGHLVQSLGIGAFIETVDDEKIVNISRSPLDQGLSTIFSYRKLRGGILRRPVPVLVTCYRPPYRLSLNEILTGLRGSIEVAREIVQSPAVKRFCEMSKVLVVAVITHLFQRMLVVGTRFGYITTGEAYIFLEIGADARLVRYSLCVPRHDVESDPVTGLHRTAVAQVLAFTLRAFRAKRMPPAWYQKAQQELWKWRVDPDDIFNKIPPLVRKMKRNIEYVPGNWSPYLERSPLEQRVQRMILPGLKPRFNEASFNDLGYFGFLTSHRIQPAGEPMDQDDEPSGQDEEPSNQDGESIEPAEILIDYQPFCTPECLWGLERFRALDKACPNFRYHGNKHLRLHELLDGLQEQLDGEAANWTQTNHKFLCRSGLYTTLLKVRLASHGYTLLLKGVIPSKIDHLCREADMYDQLLALQGFFIPVSFGMIETQNEVFSRSFGGFSLFMVFGGFPEGVMPLYQCMAAGIDKQVIVDAAERTFRYIHAERVFHFDPEPRNMLYDARQNRVIVADFERAMYDEVEGQQYLNPILQIEGVHEWTPERKRIPDVCFGQQRDYVRQRIEEFFERGY
ncbi:uncharacterized protein TrAtP1_002410 [Trichoderma atroviride]|nr:hypothetical protein TrAtP1_002410 [Trichoderma atroviride]